MSEMKIQEEALVNSTNVNEIKEQEKHLWRQSQFIFLGFYWHASLVFMIKESIFIRINSSLLRTDI